MENEIYKSNRRKLIPVTKWNNHHSWPPIGGLRYLIFHADLNGFDSCIRRVGRTVLIDEIKFFEWVDLQNDFSSNNEQLVKSA